MYDRKTDTYWDQINGRAIIGEMTGQRLERIPLDTLQWKDWKAKHPHTEVLSTETGFFRNYNRQPYGDYDTSTSLFFPVENTDERMHPKTVVYGIELNGEFKAYPEPALERAAEFTDSLAGVSIAVKFDNGIVTFTNSESGEDIVPVRGFWFAWFAFHPETSVYQGKRSVSHRTDGEGASHFSQPLRSRETCTKDFLQLKSVVLSME